ncbi:MAG: polysaccharide pyruvyl transferase family protein [Streptococcaceae bacterium]|jgi:hypothetical protein|nr:polysaccharide pyruvyl transferase family protein [Streptococcaceae bacterium]
MLFNLMMNYWSNLKYRRHMTDKPIRSKANLTLGIVTLQDFRNYGNRLQNLALVKTVEKLGYHPVSLLPRAERPNFKGLSPLLRQKQWQFIDFSKRYLDYDYSDSKEWQRYDKVIVGSDQVWNTSWMSPTRFSNYLLSTVPSLRRIAYAVSMGRSDFASQELTDMFENEILKFQYISARETQVADVIARQSHERVPIVLDPVLLLSANEWQETLSLASVHTKQQVLTYFLTVPSHNTKNFISDIISKHELNLVAFNDETQPENFVRDPRAFVQEIKNSRLVMTDSFHAVVFAIIFKVPFIVVPREDGQKMNERIEQLFNLLQLQPRWLSDVTQATAFKVDFEPVADNLAAAQNISFEFLKTALATKEEFSRESH